MRVLGAASKRAFETLNPCLSKRYPQKSGVRGQECFGPVLRGKQLGFQSFENVKYRVVPYHVADPGRLVELAEKGAGNPGSFVPSVEAAVTKASSNFVLVSRSRSILLRSYAAAWQDGVRSYPALSRSIVASACVRCDVGGGSAFGRLLSKVCECHCVLSFWRPPRRITPTSPTRYPRNHVALLGA
jgi:hypothetical protein